MSKARKEFDPQDYINDALAAVGFDFSIHAPLKKRRSMFILGALLASIKKASFRNVAQELADKACEENHALDRQECEDKFTDFLRDLQASAQRSKEKFNRRLKKHRPGK